MNETLIIKREVYIIRVNEEYGNCINEETWKTFKVCMQDKKMPSWNVKRKFINESISYIYLGKSSGKLIERLKEHFINAHDSTYSLRLYDFHDYFNNHNPLTNNHSVLKCECINFKLDVYYTNSLEDNKSVDCHMYVENKLRDAIKPLIGKK